MHPNPTFRRTSHETALDFARERSFGTLALNGQDSAPLLAHVPFLLSYDAASLELHLVRSNPIVKSVGQTHVPAVIAISGPDSYVSPDWYGIEDQVPTWNYIVVHLRGILQRLPDDDLRGVIDRLSALFEQRLAPKPPWASHKMTPDVLSRMMRQIVPYRMQVETVESTWKLNQNKADEVRLAAAEHVERSGIGSDPTQVAAAMRTAGEPE